MATWTQTTEHAGDLADHARARIEATGLGLLATLRRDGYPRVSGVEPFFEDGDLWLGMMPNSLKGKDLRRDGRLCLHNATVDKDVSEGDVKITGRAVEVADLDRKERLRQALLARTGMDPGIDFHLFRVDVEEIASIRPSPAQDALIIEWWREGGTPQRIERR